MNKKRYFKYLVLAYGLLLMSACFRKSYDEQLAEQAKDFTLKQCPKQIDECTRIDSMNYNAEQRTIEYFYTLSENLDDPNTLNNCVIEDFRENMLIKLRDDLSLKKEKENELNFHYIYFSKTNGKKLIDIFFTPKDYTGKIQLHSFNYRQTRNMQQFTKTQCPIKQNDGSTLDSLLYDSITRTLCYSYSMYGELDQDSLVELNPNMIPMLRKQLIASIKQDNSLDEARDKEHINYNFRYYSGSTKKKVIDVMIKNEELQK